MKWFSGTIPEAIAAAKNINGTFVVYIHDKLEVSTLTSETLDSEEVESVLNPLHYVAISIENGSKDAEQFAQIYIPFYSSDQSSCTWKIHDSCNKTLEEVNGKASYYPLIVVPALFFISGETGVPIEVIGGKFDVKTVLEKVKKVELSHQKREIKLDNKQADELADKKDQVSCDEPQEKETNFSNEGTTIDAASSLTTELVKEDSVPLDERLERAKLLLAEKQEQKYLQEMEDEKNKELERRRQIQELNIAKKKKEEFERTGLCNQRKKDKEEERIARERVKSQIAADRAERQTRLALIKGTDPSFTEHQHSKEVPVPVISASQDRSSVTRIKFRFPDNSSDLAQFSPSATLLEVKNYLKQNLTWSNKSFSLIATLPHRILTEDQNSLSLEELSLCPSAIVIVKPNNSSRPSRSVVPSSESFFGFFWTLLAPLTFILNYLKHMLGLERRRSNSSDSSDEEDSQDKKRPRQEGSHTTRNRPKTAYGNRLSRREGNIHRLNQNADDDDDDENNTWNGNSTQQM